MLKLGLVAVAAVRPAVRAVRRLDRMERTLRYAQDLSSPEPTMLTALAERTREASDAPFMMVGPTEGQLLAALVHALRARSVLEIGTFTGYSALAMARALPPEGRLVTCELDPDRAASARANIAASPYADRVVVMEGPALRTIERLEGPFDLVFVDADKGGYVEYYEAVLPRLAPHGLIVVDNTLHGGLDPRADAGSRQMIEALLQFNAHVAADERVEQVVLPLRDGLTVIRRVGPGTPVTTA